jgi:pyrimidine operon attenuation protein/uracil phosphoribosyltransferase
VKHKAKLLESDDLKRTLQRFAHQFIEPFDDPKPIGIIGMQTRGIFLAKRVAEYIKEFYDIDVPVGVLDVTFYRDDFRTKMKLPTVQVTEIPFDIYGKHLILVDDVLFTGRTVRSAMEAIMSFGRPASIKFCCLVDRGHRELPIYADYVGVKIPTHTTEEIRVFLSELDGEDAVYLVNREES